MSFIQVSIYNMLVFSHFFIAIASSIFENDSSILYLFRAEIINCSSLLNGIATYVSNVFNRIQFINEKTKKLWMETIMTCMAFESFSFVLITHFDAKIIYTMDNWENQLLMIQPNLITIHLTSKYYSFHDCALI